MARKADVRSPQQVRSTEGSDAALDTLRVGLEAQLGDLVRPALMLASARREEGRTSAVVALARAMAMARRRVVVVDLDLRHPGLHLRLSVPNDVGIAQVLNGHATAQQCFHYVSLGVAGNGSSPGCYVMPAGTPVEDPTALIDIERIRQLVEPLTDQADLVLVDSPPLLEGPDGFLIAQSIGSALLVVEAGRTVTKDLTQAREGLARNHVRLLGAILGAVD